MPTVAIIPARLRSSRFPKKILADILGKSLLQRTYEQVIQCSELDQTFIAVDDPVVEQHARSFGAETIMTDPSLPTGSHRIAAAIAQQAIQAEIVLNVQADEPCFDPKIGSLLIHALRNNPTASVVTPITRIRSEEQRLNPSVVKCVCDQQGRALYFSRAPIPYFQTSDAATPSYRHIGVYCFRTPLLMTYATLSLTPLQKAEDLEQLRLLEMGYPIHVCEVQESAISVDRPEDIEKVEAWLCQKAENISL